MAAPILFDAHNHLQDAWFTDHRREIFSDLSSIQVRACVVNGTCEDDWAAVAELAAASPMVIPSFGLHPWDVGNCTPAWQEKLQHHLKVVPRAIIGEIGLDRWMLERARPDDPRLAGLRRASLPDQIAAFRWQLSLAAERDLPASIHCLEAFGALLEVLTSAPRPSRGLLLHAYSGSLEMAAAFTKLGAYFSFNGAFLDPRKHRQCEVFATIAADRLLVETDAPAMRLPAEREEFTLPVSPDGQPVNHPANIRAAYAGLAGVRGISVEELAAQVAENFARLFGG
ncbi:MAG: TatD family hydrolase [Opitutus sp.]